MTVSAPGFEASALFEQIATGITTKSSADRQAMVKKVKGLFQMDIKNTAGTVQSWTIDLKNGDGGVKLGKPDGKPDIIIALSDKDFVDMASGKLNGQKAFMTGKLKVKGNMMLATKLDGVLKTAQADAKL
jgi:putative sterol carrier protein